MCKFDDDLVPRLVAFARFALESHGLDLGPEGRTAHDVVMTAMADFLEQNDPDDDPSPFREIARNLVRLVAEKQG